MNQIFNQIPQIPESFIKAYVEANGEIDEVMVEYDMTVESGYNNILSGGEESAYFLKTREDNTVIIHKVKSDKQYTAKDVHAQMKRSMYTIIKFMFNETSERDSKQVREYQSFMKANKIADKWIEENL